MPSPDTACLHRWRCGRYPPDDWAFVGEGFRPSHAAAGINPAPRYPYMGIKHDHEGLRSRLHLPVR
jgi:hypothetical protein